MAKLTAAQRHALPKSKFAGPGESYPVDTKGRAVAAKGRATQAVEAGRMSASSAAKIKAKANRVLGKSGAQDNPGHTSSNPAKKMAIPSIQW